MGRFRYGALVIESELSLWPLSETADPPSIRLKLARRPHTNSAGWRPVSRFPAEEIHRRGPNYSISLIEGVTAHLIGSDELEIFAHGDPTDVADLTIRRILPRVAAHFRELILHAACVEVRGVGLLFLGPSGAGKSTLAAAATITGAKFLSDDLTWLVTGDELSALAPISELRLRPPACEELSSRLGAGWRPRTVAGRRRWTATAPIPSTRPHLACWIEPPSSGDPTPALLTPKRAFEPLARSSFQLDPGHTGEAVARFEKLCRTVSFLRVATSPRPHWDQIEGWLDKLFELGGERSS